MAASYLALARKWRPQNFDQMVGQQHVLQALKNALERQQLHHAYLFTGTRGIGKTTIARVIAKCLNCEQGITVNPCGQCSACQDITAGRFIDLIEIDAASKTRVEDTRELLENIQYAPVRGRIKLYLIDEVHMLSGHSFNALLKTLEEPPPHVKFLLATTDPEKLPITVLSRCLRFHLKPLTIEQIQQHLAFILKQENLLFENSALYELAKAAQGSLRDALSLLDQSIAYGHGEVQLNHVRDMLGVLPKAPFDKILTALAKQDAKLLLDASAEIANQAVNYDRLLENLLHLFHCISVYQFTEDTHFDIDFDQQQLITFAEQFAPETIQLFYQIGVLCRKDLAFAPSPRIALEMALLRMLAFQPERPYELPVNQAALNQNSPVTTAQKKTSKIASLSEKKLITEKNQADLTNSENKIALDKISPFIEPKIESSTSYFNSLQDNNVNISNNHSVQANVEAKTKQTFTAKQEVETAQVKVDLSLNQHNLEQNGKIKDDLSKTLMEIWPDGLQQLNLNPIAKTVLEHSVIQDEGPGIIEFNLDPKGNVFLNALVQKDIEQAIESYLGRTVKINFFVNSQTLEDTPANIKRQAYELAREKVYQNLQKDINLQKIIKAFNVKLTIEQVEPIKFIH